MPAALDAAATEHRFSGVVARHAPAGDLTRAYGVANRATSTPLTPQTRFAIASGSKGLTALVIARLVERDLLGFETTARSVLGDDLPLIDDAVTLEQLLAHTSGIGDYLDEDVWEPEHYVLTRPVHEYLTASDFLPDLAGHPQVSPPGERFQYCNGGYMVLALIAERASGAGFHDLVHATVLEPASMTDSGYFRSDRLPERTAVGYLSEDPDALSNILHLPVLGNGDGGLYTTAADMTRFWRALRDGAIVGTQMVRRLTSLYSEVPDDNDYGLGFMLRDRPDGGRDWMLLGQDAGVSFISSFAPGSDRVLTVLANTSDGAWQMWEPLKQVGSEA